MKSSERERFRELLASTFPDISEECRDQVVRFRDLVVEENERQNLTRLLSPEDFLEGHVRDCVELLRSGLLVYPAMDLGSGVGVPGVICSILGGQQWVLAESEGKKGEFLRRACGELGLSTQVFVGRAEEYLKKGSVGSIVARAVGPVGRIYGWIRTCSTWNNLVLLKGPSWGGEWAEFEAATRKRELRIQGKHDYVVGSEGKKRVIIRLERL